ncbi:MAG: hypothetical protein ACREJB_19500 [Planctomycetaceae bacterium]
MLFVMVFSVVAAIVFLSSDLAWYWEAAAVGLVGASGVLMFGPWDVHFLVPFFMQLFVCLWAVFYYQMP